MTATLPELQQTELPRDRWGRPMVMAPNGKKREAYRRTTTFVGCLDDQSGLTKWIQRHTAFGMGQRKDLVLAAAAASPEDKKKLGEISEKAFEHSKGMAGDAAETGTALHSFTERIDRGDTLGPIPAEYKADLEAYRQATKDIEFLGIETFRVHDEWKVAGTADRIGLLHGRPVIMDVKTGSIDYPHKMAMQLAMYSRSLPYDIPTDTRGTDTVDLNVGVIIHLPAGQGRCDLYEIDIAKGWGACLIAKKVWDWRGTKGLTTLIEGPPAAPPTWTSLAMAATTTDELRTIWNRAKELGQLDADLKALLKTRSDELA